MALTTFAHGAPLSPSRWPALAVVLAVTLPALAGAQANGSPTQPPLVRAIAQELLKLNPDLQSTQLLSLLLGLDGSDSARYAALAVGRGTHYSFTDPKRAGEIFAVFAVDEQLRRPTRLLGYFITPRLRDYDAWLLQARGDSVVVCGRGDSYGDQARRWAFPFDPERFLPSPELVAQMDTVDSGDGSTLPKTCPGAI